MILMKMIILHNSNLFIFINYNKLFNYYNINCTSPFMRPQTQSTFFSPPLAMGTWRGGGGGGRNSLSWTIQMLHPKGATLWPNVVHKKMSVWNLGWRDHLCTKLCLVPRERLTCNSSNIKQSGQISRCCCTVVMTSNI